MKEFLSPKTGQTNKVYFTLLKVTMMIFKQLSLILNDTSKCKA